MVKAAKPGEEIAAFLICDHRTLRKYGLGCVPPFPMPLGHHLKTGYLKRGADLAELAASTGIDAKALEATVAAFNKNAVNGHDPDFGKGSRAYNRYQGDAQHGPNPCIAPIENGPFYAIKMVIGDLGTYAGIKTDEHARATRRRRPRDQGALCRRQRHGEHHGRQLSRRRHHARPGADVWLYRRATSCRHHKSTSVIPGMNASITVGALGAAPHACAPRRTTARLWPYCGAWPALYGARRKFTGRALTGSSSAQSPSSST